jgi:hypothetical protein
MPYFHALAVFEAREFSLEGADRAAVALLKTLRHPRMLLYEYDTSGGLGPYSPSAAALYFTVMADFDVEAQSEERAEDLAEEILESLSTDEVQFLAVGFSPGERRVTQQAQPEARPESAPEEREERGKGRRSRGRGGKKRELEREAEGRHEDSLTPTPEAETGAPSAPVEVSTPEQREEPRVITKPAIVERDILPPPAEPVEVEAVSPPPRSSSSMRVTLSVTLHASELVPQTNGAALPDQQDLIALALAEARRRYPEVPIELMPESEVVSQPWGDIVLTLTWHYEVPVPSAAEDM